MDLISKNTEKRWVKYDDEVEFCVRPYPFSLEDPKLNSVENLWERFKYCCVDWKGIDRDGKKCKCDGENKKFIFDFHARLWDFVLKSAHEVQSELDDDLKN